MSTRRVPQGYEQLISKSNEENVLLDAKMLRSATLPNIIYVDYPVQFVVEQKAKVSFIEKQMKSRVHPLFSLVERRNKKKKATAKPEFSKYMQYLKEAGIWNTHSTKPVIY